MKRCNVEKICVVVLFITVLITFSFAQRDSKRLHPLYTATKQQGAKVAFVAPAVAKPAQP